MYIIIHLLLVLLKFVICLRVLTVDSQVNLLLKSYYMK